jgi:hypothetical protein
MGGISMTNPQTSVAVTVVTVDTGVIEALFGTANPVPESTVSLSSDTAVKLKRHIQPRGFGVMETIELVVIFASNVGAQLLSSWLYDKLSSRKAKVVIEGGPEQFPDVSTIHGQLISERQSVTEIPNDT